MIIYIEYIQFNYFRKHHVGLVKYLGLKTPIRYGIAWTCGTRNEIQSFMGEFGASQARAARGRGRHHSTGLQWFGSTLMDIMGSIWWDITISNTYNTYNTSIYLSIHPSIYLSIYLYHMIFGSVWQWGVPHNGRFFQQRGYFSPVRFTPQWPLKTGEKDVEQTGYTTGFMVYNWIYLICGIMFGQTWGIDGKPQDFVQRVLEYIAILLRRGW